MEESARSNNKEQPINLLSKIGFKQRNKLINSSVGNLKIVKQSNNSLNILNLNNQVKNISQNSHFLKKHTFNSLKCRIFFKVHSILVLEINGRLSVFPILEKISTLLNAISIQYLQVFKFSNEKWESEYKLIEDQLKLKAILPPLKTDLCPKCCESKWHQQIKSQKHQIFNLRINDPFSYYQESVLSSKEPYG